MADIGPRIGIDGEAEFRKTITQLSQVVRTYGTEMKAVTSEFADNAKSQEALTKQNQVLTKSIDAQEKKLNELRKGLEYASKEYGENDQKTLKWAQAVNNATADLNKMKNQVKQNETALDSLENGVEDVAESLEDAGDSAVSFGDILGANLAADAIKSAISGIVSGLKQITEESREYRKIMGSLEVSSKQAGYSADETKQSYNELYGVLADNQTAATTTANLQALGLGQQELSRLIDGTIGAWARYGDSIPIDGLAEAINETVKAGTVTGTFADVLNWAGTNEDEFNAKLAAAGSESERTNLILQELANQGLMEAGQAWQENNKSLVEANQAAAGFEEKTAALGETVEPVFTAIQSAVNGILSVLVALAGNVDFELIASGILSVGELFTQFAEGISNGNLTIGEGFSTLSSTFSEIISTMVSRLGEALPGFLEKGTEIITNMISGISSVLSELYAKGGELMSGLIKIFLDNLPGILESGVKILLSMIEGIVKTVPQMLSSANQVIASLVAGFLQNLPQLLETGIKLLGEVAAGIIRAIPDIVAAVPQITSSFWKEITAYDWAGIGGDIIAGLVRGVLGAIESVVDAAKQAAGRIANAFTDFFDIRSPSHFMEDYVSGNIMKGAARGFTKYTNLAVKSATRAASDIAGAFPSELSVPVMANGTVAAYDRLSAQLSNMQIVLDGKKVVGYLTPDIDNTMGGYAKIKGRYNT